MRVLIIPDVKPPSPAARQAAWEVLPDLFQSAEFIRREISASIPPQEHCPPIFL
jgi:hypothetical protein